MEVEHRSRCIQGELSLVVQEKVWAIFRACRGEVWIQGLKREDADDDNPYKTATFAILGQSTKCIDIKLGCWCTYVLRPTGLHPSVDLHIQDEDRG